MKVTPPSLLSTIMRSFAIKRPLMLKTRSLKDQRSKPDWLLQAQTIGRAIGQPTETSDDSDRAPSFGCLVGDRGNSETASVIFSDDPPPSYSDVARRNASHTDESSVDRNFPEVNFEDGSSTALYFGEIYQEHDLGSFEHPEDEKLPEVLTSTDLFNIFEDIFKEEQPRLDELGEAFDVFDENKDGFIDARELQRTLFALEMKEIADIEDCKKMIRAFDENTDGRIDFYEFVKLMEATCS
ncbi:calcium-binding protein CML37-like [Cynara cardunculus var. scolymus]|uniref:Calcium-binding EF-hand n=1 Tax=Cynara cardunculus var. scolymus TaxID=59895 RepID=A0A118K527_CYNCS|nr:calcium-binding protein CML37-like [Cynara cardunculus var. scolymus]KVI08445.1 Calcium-binding EF-hand [Cynara cardunculus var. scolymus]